MKREKFLTGFILTSVLILLNTSSSQAAGVSFNGSLETAVTYSSPDILIPQTSFDNILNLKMEINSGEKQSGVVLLQYKYTVPSDVTQLIINQAYLDLQLSPNSILRAGRQKISWGTGFAWNPTNYIGAAKNRADLTTVYPGVDAINYEHTWGQSSGVLLLKPSSQGRLSDWGWAVKYGFQVLHSDISLSTFRQGDANAFGADFATTIGDFTVYTELASKTGKMLYIDPGITKLDRPSDQYYIHGIVGVQGMFSNNWMAQLEYYYNQEGWDDQEAQDYKVYLSSQSVPSDMAKYFADLRQHYLFAMVRKGDLIEDLSLTFSAFWNMDDQSYLLNPMLEYKLGQNTAADLLLYCYGGDSSSEFGSQFYCQVIGRLKLSF
jgi:hypothetical protein